MKKKNSLAFIGNYLDKHLHIVAFDVPYPADYGGVTDVFYRIQWLHKAGIKIHLHCFTKGRAPQEILKTLCESVNYYQRASPLASLSLSMPYIVQSRKNIDLQTKLMQDNYPILIEGVHCSAILLNPAFKNRQVLLRQHNLEYRYYAKLAGVEKNIFKRIYFSVESKLLKKYEEIISGKALLLPINENDLQIFTSEFHAVNPVVLPAFTPWNQVKSRTGRGDYCLYHGNLSVVENDHAVRWLIEKVFDKLSVKLIIAGKLPSAGLISLAKSIPNVSLMANPTDAELQILIEHAHINVLPSFNNTGLKLKLLNALFNGRYCIVTRETVMGSGLEDLCIISADPGDFSHQVMTLLQKDFSEADRNQREEILFRDYDNQKNTDLLSSLIRWHYQ